MKNIFILRLRTLILLMLALIVHGPVNGQTDPPVNLPQFLFPAFDTGIVRLKTGEYSKSLMNYNTLTGKMTFYHRNEILDLVRPETVDTVLLAKKYFIPFSDGFYELIFNGESAFFAQHRSEMVSEGKPAALGTTSQTTGVTSVSKFMSSSSTYNLKLPENFKVTSYNVFWVRRNGEMSKFLNIHQLFRLFPSQGKELKDFIKREKIDLDKTADLLKIAIYCNGLQK
jgi:hypothetical protein